MSYPDAANRVKTHQDATIQTLWVFRLMENQLNGAGQRHSVKCQRVKRPLDTKLTKPGGYQGLR